MEAFRGLCIQTPVLFGHRLGQPDQPTAFFVRALLAAPSESFVTRRRVSSQKNPRANCPNQGRPLKIVSIPSLGSMPDAQTLRFAGRAETLNDV